MELLKLNCKLGPGCPNACCKRGFYLSFLRRFTYRYCSYVYSVIRMFYHWNVEMMNKFYFQNKHLMVLLPSHPLFQALPLQSFSGSAHSGLIYAQECDICRCPWWGTRWTGHVRAVSEECLGLTSSAFAGGCTNTEGASATFHRKGESK